MTCMDKTQEAHPQARHDHARGGGPVLGVYLLYRRYAAIPGRAMARCGPTWSRLPRESAATLSRSR